MGNGEKHKEKYALVTPKHYSAFTQQFHADGKSISSFASNMAGTFGKYEHYTGRTFKENGIIWNSIKKLGGQKVKQQDTIDLNQKNEIEAFFPSFCI